MTYEMEGQMSIFDLDSWYGKTSQELSAPTKAMTSEPSLKRQSKLSNPMPLFLNLRKVNGRPVGVSWETDGRSLGEYMMHNFGAYLSAEKGYAFWLTGGGDSAGKILFELWRETDYTEANETVADTGDESRQQVQFVGESLSRNTEQGRAQGQGIAGDVKVGASETSATFDVRISSDGTKNWRAHCYETDRCRALDTGGENPDSNHGGIAVVSPNGGIISPPLDSHYYLGCGNRGGVEREVVACYSQDAYDKFSDNEQSASMRASGGVYGGGSEALVIQ